MSKLFQFILCLALFCGCSGSSNVDFSQIDKEDITEFHPKFQNGQVFVSTKVFSSEEKIDEENFLRIYKFDKYQTTIKALDSNGLPIAGERKYLESFLEVTNKKISNKRGKYEGKTVVFKPNLPPEIDGKTLEIDEANSFRLVGFEEIFLPEKIINNDFNTEYSFNSEKIKAINHFFHFLKIIPDKSNAFVKLLKMPEKNDGIWTFSIRWSISGLIASTDPTGVKLNLVGKLIYSKIFKGITYFELKSSNFKDSSSFFNIIINREYIPKKRKNIAD